MKKVLYLTLFLTLVLFTAKSFPQDLLKVKGQQIVDSKGNEFITRGMGLGGWMLQEGYMLQIYNGGMQHLIKSRITELIGKEECDRFYELWHKNHMTKADVDSLAKWGFNSIRLPMHYNLFTLPIELEPAKGQNTWLNIGFDMTDSLLSWCKSNNIYLFLDLHAAPGGQGKDANISDYDTSKPSLWESDLNKQKTIALWRKLAERYSNEPNIAGYDLINEPNWTFEGKDRHGREDVDNKPIWDLYKEITKAIREVDKNHIIIIEGNGWGNNYNGFPGLWDDNLVFSFHKYWNPNNQKDIAHIVAMREKHNAPVWLGESGENSDKWFTDAISLLEQNKIGWAWWPLKKINNVICPLRINAPEDYQKLTSYWNNGSEKPSRELASRVLFEIAENLKAGNCRFNKDVIDAMFRQVKDKSPVPFKNHEIPGRIYAVDYDMGYENYAYHDLNSENTGEEGKKFGNKAHIYRNEGVDIEKSDDPADSGIVRAGDTNPIKVPISGSGYVVSSIEDNEWVNYTVNVKFDKTFGLQIRTSSEKNSGKIRIELDGKSIGNIINVPVSAEGQKWQTIDAGNLQIPKGRHQLKLIFDKGGFKLNFFEFN